MKHNQWRWRLALAAALASIVAFAAALYPHERLLLERATKVADMRGLWSPAAIEESAVDYRWVSEAVLFTGTREWRMENPFLYDIRSQRKTPLSRLSQHLTRDRDLLVSSWELSPDGQWLLWKIELTDNVRAARLDGSGFQIIPLPPPADTVGMIGWRDTPGHWIAEGFDYGSRKVTNVFGGDVNMPGQPFALPLSEGERFFDTNVLQVGEQLNMMPLRVAGDDAVTLDYNGKTIPLHVAHVSRINEVIQSRRSNRLAWMLFTNPPTSVLVPWFGRIFPHSDTARSSVAIWVSRLDGSDIHEMGHVMLNADADETPNHLRWLPSDSRLSFLFKDTLWTVPVD